MSTRVVIIKLARVQCIPSHYLIYHYISVNIDIIGIEAQNAYTCVVVSTASCTLQTHNVINFYDCISANIENNVNNKFLCMLGHNTIIH